MGGAFIAYKEFLELVLPKEHADLRAFVTQRACYDIESEEFLSYETEAALANLLELEILLHDELIGDLRQLENAGVGPQEMVAEITGSATSPIKFNDLQSYLQECGLLPYEQEIISFLRRLDINDDGVVTVEEIDTFFGGFTRLRQRKFQNKASTTPTCQRKLRSFSPNRRIVENRMVLMSPGKVDRVIYEEEIVTQESVEVQDHTVVPPPKPQTITVLGE